MFLKCNFKLQKYQLKCPSSARLGIFLASWARKFQLELISITYLVTISKILEWNTYVHILAHVNKWFSSGFSDNFDE